MNTRTADGRGQNGARYAPRLSHWRPAGEKCGNAPRLVAINIAGKDRLIARRYANQSVRLAEPLQRLDNGIGCYEPEFVRHVSSEKLKGDRGKFGQAGQLAELTSNNNLEPDIH